MDLPVRLITAAIAAGQPVPRSAEFRESVESFKQRQLEKLDSHAARYGTGPGALLQAAEADRMARSPTRLQLDTEHLLGAALDRANGGDLRLQDGLPYRRPTLKLKLRLKGIE